MMLKFTKYSSLCLFTAARFASADIHGHVVRVLDGDTVEVLEPGNRLTRVRGWHRCAGKESALWPAFPTGADRTDGRQVSACLWKYRDRYGRLLGTIWSDTTDINAVQVKTGMALGLPVSRQGIGSGICRTGEAGTGEPVGSVGRPIPG